MSIRKSGIPRFNKILIGKIDNLDYEKGICDFTPRNGGKAYPNVPIPQYAGLEGHGLFMKYANGTDVIAAHIPDNEQTILILQPVPTPVNYHYNFQRLGIINRPEHISDFPSLNGTGAGTPGIVLAGPRGSGFSVANSGDLLLGCSNSNGIYIKNRNGGEFQSAFLASHQFYSFTTGSYVKSGIVKRLLGDNRAAHIAVEPGESPVRADTSEDVAAGIYDIGLFPKDAVWDPSRQALGYSRNPRRAESVTKYYEYATSSVFSGMDDESERASGKKDIDDTSDSNSRDFKPGNCLHLAENELIEIVAGNLIDINANILDINYNGTMPTYVERSEDTRSNSERYEEIRLRTRREIGYHFQLNGNIKGVSSNYSESNFLFDIDKEGVLKLNIPASSDTGNIPYSINADFLGPGDNIKQEYAKPTHKEPVPITLRDFDGNIVYPKKGASGNEDAEGIRSTGVSYYNDQGYFPATDKVAEGSSVRVYTTKHHNMYAAAERLIANRIQKLNKPNYEGSAPLENFKSAFRQPWEVHPSTERDDDDQLVKPYPHYMTTADVKPGDPAINPGGTLVVAGRAEENYPHFSNSFETFLNPSTGEAEVKVTGPDGYPKSANSGGKSANINMNGSIEMSVGKDNYDQKSIVLDAAGSLVAWFGKDKNKRSMVVQTDGEVCFNIGGSYDTPESFNDNDDLDQVSFNQGRLDIRVNVTDMGLFGDDQTNVPISKKYGDFVISIGEHGLVIAGAAGKPMLIRNDSDIRIESGGKLHLSGASGVDAIDAKLKPKDLMTGGTK